MTEKEVIYAIKYMQKYQTETDKVEAKTAEKGCPQKCYDTISAFANKYGGIIIFGINEHNNFIEQDVYDVNDLQKQITSLCTTSLEPKIRPEFLALTYNKKKLLAVKINELPQKKKPCYYKKAGINKGSYIRIGDSDEHMTDYEIYSLQSYSDGIEEDLRPIKRAEYEDLNQEKIQQYIEEMLDKALAFVRRNIGTMVIIDNDGKRTDVPHYPMKALREAIANALIHRDYSINTDSAYIYLRIFDDRIEILNPGGLYGNNRLENLGSDNILEVRNNTIIRLLEDTTDIVENRHTGIATMREEMKKMNLPEPEFENIRGTFKVTFRKEKKEINTKNETEQFSDRQDRTEMDRNEKMKPIQERILDLIMEDSKMTQIQMAEKLGVTRSTVSSNLKVLKEKGVIERIGSDRNGYWKTEQFLGKQNRIEVDRNKKMKTTQERILDLIMEDSKMTQIQMAEKLEVTRSTISSNLKILKEKGIIERIGSDRNGYWKTEQFLGKQNRTEVDRNKKMKPIQEKILDLIIENSKITQIQMAKRLGVTRSTISLNLKILKEKGIIKRVGSDRNGYWKILK